MIERQIVVVLDVKGERIDKALADSISELSRAQFQRLIKNGLVTISGKPVKAGQRVEGGECVQVILPPTSPAELEPESIPLDIRYEDEDLILVNKPAGIVVHPAAGHDYGTLVNAILAHSPDLAGIGGERRPGVVHRLDKDTSGLILFAKNDRALRYLQRQFKEHHVGKVYLALINGRFANHEILIDAPIGRDPRNRKRMAVIPPGSSAQSRPAQTRVKRVRDFDGLTLVECRPLTGRTHQIRVHLAYIGHPIVGDSIYGQRKQTFPIERQFLHASKLTFRRPSDQQELSFSAELPEELQTVLLYLEGLSR